MENAEKILSDLTKVKKILDKGNVEHWLDFGTFLGAIRENSIIPHDDDFDLGMMRGELNKLLSLKNEFLKEGIRIFVRGQGIGFRDRENQGLGGIFTYYDEGEFLTIPQEVTPRGYAKQKKG